MKGKLLNKIALAGASMLACVACLGVAVNAGRVNVTADDTKVTLPGGVWTDVNDYNLKWNSSNTQPNVELYATPVTKTNAASQTLKGVELSSVQTYTLANSASYPVNGYSMAYSQSLTLKVNSAIDMSEPVEFFFSPYVISGTC